MLLAYMGSCTASHHRYLYVIMPSHVVPLLTERPAGADSCSTAWQLRVQGWALFWVQHP
jgi:hypothetical protein